MLILCTAFVMSLCAPVTSGPLERQVADAIGTFEPYWSPLSETTRGWVVALDPALGSSGPRTAVATDELSLLTAGHLYHHVMAAGGTPVLTSADTVFVNVAREGEVERRVRVIREARAALCVSIAYDSSVENVTVSVANGGSGGDAESNVRLARGMLAALGQPDAEVVRLNTKGSVLHVLAGGATSVPAACEVRLPCPAGTSLDGRRMRLLSRTHARTLCAGIARFCAERRPASDSPNSSGRTDCEHARTVPVPDIPTGTMEARLRGVGRLIWPEGSLPDIKLDWFCRMFSRLTITDRSLVYFKVSARRVGGEVVLRGSTNAPSVIDGLASALRGVGVESVRKGIRTLPDRSKLGEECFGICRVSMALTRSEPSETAGAQTQLLFGEPVFLLDRTERAYLLHASDGYWGWVDQNAIQPVTADRFAAYIGRRQGVLMADFANDRLAIPRGARVALAAGGMPYRVLLPDGSEAEVPAELVRCDADERATAAATRVRAALDLLNTPYIFGGRSPLGLDCSGLVTNVWARAGQSAARDAWQQALDGTLVATWWHRERIRPGDQVFFVDVSGKIYHVGVAISSTHVVHSSPPGVRIGSLRPADRLYDARLDRDFFMVKRP